MNNEWGTRTYDLWNLNGEQWKRIKYQWTMNKDQWSMNDWQRTMNKQLIIKKVQLTMNDEQ